MNKTELSAELEEVKAREQKTNRLNAQLTIENSKKIEIIEALATQLQQTLEMIKALS